MATALEGSTRRYVIKIKAGVYEKNVEVSQKKNNLMFVGDGRTITIITANRNAADGSDTFNFATVVIQKCRIDAASDLVLVIDRVQTYLGRPWKRYSRTVVMQTEINKVINPTDWDEWDNNYLDTLYYVEYANTGAGGRHREPGKLNMIQGNFGFRGSSFHYGSIHQGGSWLNFTGFPYSLGLLE